MMFPKKQLSFAVFDASYKIKSDDPIKIIFDNVNWDFIYDLVAPVYSKHSGVDAYDPVSLFKALLLIYLGEVDSDRKLANRIKFDTRHAFLCGFYDFKTPSHATFSIFRKRLGDIFFFDILHQIIAQAISYGIIKGIKTAIDATHLWAFSNRFGKKLCDCKDKNTCEHERVYSDKDAAWGHKTKEYSFFGYKVHLVVDVDSQLPVSIKVTPGNESDITQVKDIINSVKEKHPNLSIKQSSMDCGYDSYETHRFFIEDAKITPIIPLRNNGTTNPILNGESYLNEEGIIHCFAGYKLINWGFDKERNRTKFRCPSHLGRISCMFSSSCNKSSYGRTFYVSETHNYRLIGPIPRGTKTWKEEYNTRTATERCNSELKGEHKLDKVRVRGINRVKIHVALSIIAQIVKRIGTFAYNERYAFSSA